MGYPSYAVTWKDSKGNIFDISKDIYTLPQFTSTGSGEVNAAVIILSADRGQYMTFNPYHPTDTTNYPPISDFDQINILSVDGQTGFIYNRTFEVKRRIPSENKGQGDRVEIHLLGLEWHSQVSNYAKLHFIDSAFGVGKAIQKQYNANKGTLDPTMAGLDDPTYNKMPTWTANNYDYGLNEEKSYNRLTEVIDKLGMPVNAGGVFKYFELRTLSPDFTNIFTFVIAPSGENDSGVIITQSQGVNIGESEGGLDTLKATVLNAWGANDLGSLPTGYSKFAGGQILYPNFSPWDESVSYPQDALVQYLGTLWKSIITNNLANPPGPGIFWTEVTRADYYGNQYRYSEWTVGQKNKWIDCGSNLSNIGNSTTYPYGIGFFDMNVTVNDGTYRRIGVDLRVKGTSVIDSKWQYVGSPINGYYEGLRVLVDGAGVGQFLGIDINNTPFSNNIVEYQGDDLGWVVIEEHRDNMVVAVISEGQTYVWNDIDIAPNAWGLTTGSASISVAKDVNALDCFHPYDSVINDDIDPIDPTFTINQASAIKVTYSWDSSSFILGPTVGRSDVDWYKAGAWLTLRFPFPPNFVNEIGGVVGGEYGSNNIIKGPAFIDSDNMSLSHDGKEGFCQGLSSEDFGPLASLDFLIKLKATYPTLSGDTLASNVNYKIRVAVRDKNDNVAIQDFVIPFNNNTFPVKLPLNGFDVYPARQPLSTTFSFIVPPVGVSPVNIFEWRHVKEITWQTLESYDSNGRYNPNPTTNPSNPYSLPFKTENAPLIPNLNTFHKIELWIDSLHFSKPLLANSETQGDRNIETEFLQNGDILTYQQLKGSVQEAYQRFTFPHEEYDITTTLRYDIGQGDTFYYRNDRLVSANDMAPDGISAHTRKLVAKRIEYSFTKPSEGFGGALRRIIGVHVFGA